MYSFVKGIAKSYSLKWEETHEDERTKKNRKKQGPKGWKVLPTVKGGYNSSYPS